MIEGPGVSTDIANLFSWIVVTMSQQMKCSLYITMYEQIARNTCYYCVQVRTQNSTCLECVPSLNSFTKVYALHKVTRILTQAQSLVDRVKIFQILVPRILRITFCLRPLNTAVNSKLIICNVYRNLSIPVPRTRYSAWSLLLLGVPTLANETPITLVLSVCLSVCRVFQHDDCFKK